MNGKNALLLIVAVVCGLVSAVLVKFAISPPNANARVLVAKNALPMWASLEDYENQFVLVEVPREALPGHAVTSFEQLKETAKDSRLDKAMKANEPLSLDNIIDKSQAGLAGKLRKGFTAYPVRTSAMTSVDGLIQTDNFVKVIAVKKTQQGDKRSRILMKNIRVVAVDIVPDRSKEQTGHIPNTFTLEVTDDEAKKLRLAQDDGPLSFSLIALSDLEGKDLYKPENRRGEEEQVAHQETLSPIIYNGPKLKEPGKPEESSSKPWETEKTQPEERQPSSAKEKESPKEKLIRKILEQK